MPKQRLQDVYVKGLLALGYTELPPKSKYRVFCKDFSMLAPYVFVGKRGALRYASVNRVVRSIPFGPKNLAVIIAKAGG